MPPARSFQNLIEGARNAIAVPIPTKKEQSELLCALRQLRSHLDEIAKDLKSVEALLTFASEIEVYRGKGSQCATTDVAHLILYLIDSMKERLVLRQGEPELFARETVVPRPAAEVSECLGLLADYAFSRTQGPPVRSRHAGELRAIAWRTLESIAEILRRPEYLAHSLKVAADKKASVAERTAAVGFLSAYWREEAPDAATVRLLSKLEKNPPDRDFLVTVLQTQIDLGLREELDALFAVETWDED